MKEQLRILIIGLLAVSVFAGAVQAEERSRVGELRGTFVRLTEQRVGERGYLGVVIKPLEGREHATVLLSQSQQELVAMARELQEGQRLGVAYVTEAGHKWVRELAVERDRQARRRPDQERARRGTEALWARLERLEAMVEELHEQIARLRAELRRSRAPREDPRTEVRRERESRDRRAREERPQSEREVAMHQLEVMEMGLHALRQANRADAAELLTLAIRACEMMLEGRRDEEVEAVRERAPTREQLAEILSMAADLWRQFDRPDRAAQVGQLAGQLAGRERGQTRDRPERAGSERDVVRHQLEVMRMALPALKEADRAEAAELLALAIRSREMMLEGRRDEEAQAALERAPSREQLAEILAMAARLWREFDKPDKAAVVGQLAEQMAARERSRTNERGSRNESEREAVLRQLKVMRYALHALAEADNEDAADLLERAIHARELLLEGRRDDEAMRVREGAPNRASQIEIL
ncbi:MAG: hypothetical protein JSU94_03185, partial [Phycisphaerales bacterium]